MYWATYIIYIKLLVDRGRIRSTNTKKLINAKVLPDAKEPLDTKILRDIQGLVDAE